MSKSKANASANEPVDLPNGVKVHFPEDGGPIGKPVTVEFNGAQIVCHDVRSLVSTISMTLAQFVTAIVNRKQGGGKQGAGPERAWANAEKYMVNYNKGKPESEHITKHEARKLLKQEKDRQILELLHEKLQEPPPAKKRKKSA